MTIDPEMLIAYVDGELGPEDAAKEIRTCLTRCASCTPCTRACAARPVL